MANQLRVELQADGEKQQRHAERARHQAERRSDEQQQRELLENGQGGQGGAHLRPKAYMPAAASQHRDSFTKRITGPGPQSLAKAELVSQGDKSKNART